jgi:hypothetical protein
VISTMDSRFRGNDDVDSGARRSDGVTPAQAGSIVVEDRARVFTRTLSAVANESGRRRVAGLCYLNPAWGQP